MSANDKALRAEQHRAAVAAHEPWGATATANSDGRTSEQREQDIATRAYLRVHG